MVKQSILLFVAGLLALFVCSSGAEVVVLTEKPIAQFTLPDGSVLNNAFVWRRNSEGIMIVHDDGQFFLNFKLLPDDWRAAYLGIDPNEVQEEEPEPETMVKEDKYRIEDLLRSVPGLSDDGVKWLLREDAVDMDHERALTIALFHCLAKQDRDRAKRYFLLIDEKGYKIGSVNLEKIFTKCSRCSAKGEYEQACPDCEATGECSACEGTGLEKNALGKSTTECEACEKTGECPGCEGTKKAVLPCKNCRGRGQILNLQYCAVNRDYVVRLVNIEIGAVEAGSLIHDERAGLKQMVEKLPDLDEEARAFYLSPEYTGGADDFMLTAAVMQNLLEEKGTDAAHFNHMFATYYPKNKLLNIEDYVKICNECKGKGYIETDCTDCKRGKGKGKCVECNGSGIGKTELRKETECEACEGSGECPVCKGDGKAIFKCKPCEMRGRILEELRAEVKLEITVDELNSFYKTYLKEKEAEAEGGDEAALEPLP